MITIISGTNRKGSNTKLIALEYQRVLAHMEVEAGLLALDEVDIADMAARGPAFRLIQDDILHPTRKFIMILPEYNGSFPGILKFMMDCTDPKLAWWHKKALLVGVATGRAGNLRGMEHLTGSLMHIKMLVHPNRLPISSVDRLLDADGLITDEGTLHSIRTQVREFLAF